MLLFECQIQYDKQTGDDNPGRVKENYLIMGTSPSDVEKRLIEEVGPYIFGDSEVQSIKKRNFYDIFEKDGADRWFAGKVELITIEDSGVETRKKVNVLVQANDISSALKDLRDKLCNIDCEIISISKSNILEYWKVELDNSEEAK